MAERALEKPFFAFESIFRYKRFVNFNIARGDLYVVNIRLKDSVFVQEITGYMQQLDANALLFERRMTMPEFYRFADRLVKRVNLSDHRNLLPAFLRENKIDTIEVDSEAAMSLFENNPQHRGDIKADFSVKQLVLRRLGDDLTLMADIDARGQAALDERRIDFGLDLIRYLLPEQIASIPTDQFQSQLAILAAKLAEEEDEEHKRALSGVYQAVYRLADYHHDREKIVAALDDSLRAGSVTADLAREMTTPSGAVRHEIGSQIDELICQAFQESSDGADVDSFVATFARLLKTGQQGKAIQVVAELMEMLERPEPMRRQTALALLEGAVKSFNLISDRVVCEAVIKRVVERLNARSETYEYSEVIWWLIDKTFSQRRFDLLAQLTSAMAARRRFVDSVTIYDSMAVKHAFSNINRPEVINGLIDETVKADRETGHRLKEILVAIGSEEVALALSHIISHPVRQIRQHTLKILADLGKASLKVFAQLMADDSMFERERDRHELPDARWYVVRNTIFVLGSLKDPQGVPALRLRINDPDIRVRREIVRALESIGGEDACDLLIVMADDRDREIAEAAVVSAGIIGRPEAAPLFVDLAHRRPALSARAVHALGGIGGDEAKAYLIKLLGCEDELVRLVGGGVSKEDLRLAVVKALGKIGDDEAIQSIKAYRDNLSTTKKLFSKNSPVNKAIAEIMARR